MNPPTTSDLFDGSPRYRSPKSRSPRNKPARLRARRLLNTKIEYISNPLFEVRNAELLILGEAHPDPMTGPAEGTDSAPLDSTENSIPWYLKHLYRFPVLSPGQEVALFRQLNYLKYRAQQVQRTLNAEHPCHSLMDDLESFLKRAEVVRHRLIQCNLRVVVAIARKFADLRLGIFEEFISEGNLILIAAVDEFNCSRGFRFTTYATHAIQRSLLRHLKQRTRSADSERTGWPEILNELLEISEDTEQNSNPATHRNAIGCGIRRRENV